MIGERKRSDRICPIFRLLIGPGDTQRKFRSAVPVLLQKWVHCLQQKPLDAGGGVRQRRLHNQHAVQIDLLANQIERSMQFCKSAWHPKRELNKTAAATSAPTTNNRLPDRCAPTMRASLVTASSKPLCIPFPAMSRP